MDVFNGPNLSAAAIVCGALSGLWLRNHVVLVYVIAGTFGFGIGSGASTTLKRLAKMMKDGSASRLIFGQGVLAALAISCLLVMCDAIPQMMERTGEQNPGFQAHYSWLVFGIVAGFLQHSDLLSTLLHADEAQVDFAVPPVARPHR